MIAVPGWIPLARGSLSPERTVILGVDPGLADLGWGVVCFQRGVPFHRAHGSVKTEAGSSDWERARVQVAAVRALAAEHKVDVIAVEEWVFFGNAQVTNAAHSLGLVIGGIICDPRVPVVTAGRSQDWRLSLGLSRTASKPEVQAYVQKRLSMDKIPRPQHASDALAVALAAFPKL